MKTISITNYEVINGTKSDKVYVNHPVSTVADVRKFKAQVYEKEKKSPKVYDIVFGFHNLENEYHLLAY